MLFWSKLISNLLINATEFFMHFLKCISNIPPFNKCIPNTVIRSRNLTLHCFILLTTFVLICKYDQLKPFILFQLVYFDYTLHGATE